MKIPTASAEKGNDDYNNYDNKAKASSEKQEARTITGIKCVKG